MSTVRLGLKVITCKLNVLSASMKVSNLNVPQSLITINEDLNDIRQRADLNIKGINELIGTQCDSQVAD